MVKVWRPAHLLFFFPLFFLSLAINRDICSYSFFFAFILFSFFPAAFLLRVTFFFSSPRTVKIAVGVSPFFPSLLLRLWRLGQPLSPPFLQRSPFLGSSSELILFLSLFSLFYPSTRGLSREDSPLSSFFYVSSVFYFLLSQPRVRMEVSSSCAIGRIASLFSLLFFFFFFEGPFLGDFFFFFPPSSPGERRAGGAFFFSFFSCGRPGLFLVFFFFPVLEGSGGARVFLLFFFFPF